MTNEKYTIDGLQRVQNDLKRQLDESKENIATHWSQLFAPPKADTKVQRWVNQAERVVAVYDGFMMAYKLINRFHLFAGIFKHARKHKRQK